MSLPINPYGLTAALRDLVSPQERAFLISHMRANTSLLGHILNSHPQVDGSYELQNSYDGRLSLLRQTYLYFSGEGTLRRKRYLFDKLLHNSLSLSPQIARRAKILVMAREPIATVESIVRLFSRDEDHPFSKPDSALGYYERRLAEIIRISERIKQRCLYVDSDQLRETPDVVLARLSDYLDLGESLRPEYTLNKHTGKRGKGDSSSNIFSGKILGREKKIPQRFASLDYARAEALFQELQAQLGGQ
ncbi:MAG: sulfotransferase [Pseudomonadota bacterium]